MASAARTGCHAVRDRPSLDDREPGRAEQAQALELGQRPGASLRALGGVPWIDDLGGPEGRIVAEGRSVLGQRRPARSTGALDRPGRPPRLPGRPSGDRRERLGRAPQDRDPAGRVEQRQDLGRRLARGQRDVDRQDLRPARGRGHEVPGHTLGDGHLAGQRAVGKVVDDRQHVVGARPGEGVQDSRVGHPLVGRAPRVDRVADVAEGGQIPGDRRPGRGRDGRQVGSDGLGQVGDQRRLAGRDGDHAGPALADAPAEPAAASVQLGRLEQGIEVGAADDAGRGQGRVGCPGLTGQRTRVGDGCGLGLGAPADLQGQDRLAHRQGPIGQGEEPFGPLEALDEQDDRVGLGVVQAVGHVVAHVEDDLAARPDDPAEADPGPEVDERIGHRAALGDPGNMAPRRPGIDVPDIDGAVRGPVDHAHAVRAEDGQAVPQGDLAHVALHPGGRLAALDHAAARDQDAPGTRPGCLVGHTRRPERVERHEDAVGRLGQGAQVRIARRAPGLVVLRVDEVAAGLAAHLQQVVPDDLADVGSRRCPDDRDRARGEQGLQVDRRGVGPGRWV